MTWFPHPFFPQAGGSEHELIKINLDVDVAHNDGYEMAPSGFIRRRGWPWQRDHYLPLDINQGQKLVVLQRHPVVGLVSAIADYSPTYFPIWGNPQTFSWEPMIDRTIAANQIAEWQIDYVF